MIVIFIIAILCMKKSEILVVLICERNYYYIGLEMK